MKKAILILAVMMMAGFIATSAIADTVTISGPDSVWDSPLRSDWADCNIGQNGGDRQWRMFSDTAEIQRHNLMKFDLSGIPEGATITSATLGIYIRRYGDVPDVTGYKISRLQNGKDWVEGTNDYADPAFAGDPTWNSQAHGSKLWDTPGATGAGDIDLATTIVWDLPGGASDPGYVTFDLTAFVQDWVNGTWENNGILFWGGSGGNNDIYNWAYLSESSEIARLPYLMIDYTVEVVPEPSSLISLAVFGLGSIGLIKRRKA